jgi:hypothetical protein
MFRSYTRRTMTSNTGIKSNMIESVSNGVSIMFLLGTVFIYVESKFDKLDEKFTTLDDKIITQIKESEKEVITRNRAEHRKWSWFGLAY